MPGHSSQPCFRPSFVFIGEGLATIMDREPNQEDGMASNRTRRSARVTPTGKNALGIQKMINQDYVQLGRDYKKLFVELWNNPTARWILGGVVLTSVIPFVIKALKSDEEGIFIIRSRGDIRDFDPMNA